MDLEEVRVSGWLFSPKEKRLMRRSICLGDPLLVQGFFAPFTTQAIEISESSRVYSATSCTVIYARVK